jgi:hypothetical protein
VWSARLLVIDGFTGDQRFFLAFAYCQARDPMVRLAAPGQRIQVFIGAQ